MAKLVVAFTMLFSFFAFSKDTILTDEEYNALRADILTNYAKLPVEAVLRTEELLLQYQGRFTLRQALRLNYTKAYFQVRAEQFEQAIHTLAHCKVLAEQLKDPALTTYYYSYLAGIFSNLENYQLAMETYLKALEVSKLANDNAMVARLKNNIGHMLIKLEQFENAQPYIKEFYEFGVEQDVWSYKATGLNNYGEIALGQGLVNEAEQHFLASLAIREQHKSVISSSWSHHNLGRVYLAKGKYEQAKKHLNRSITIRDSSEKHILALAPKLTLANVYLTLNESKKAYALLTEVIDIATEKNRVLLLIEAYHLLKEYHVLAGQYRLAINALDKMLIYQSAFNDAKSNATLIHFMSLVKANAQELTNAELRRQRELAQQLAESKQQQMFIVLASAGAILVVILFFLRYLSSKNRALFNTIKELKQTQLELIEADKMSAMTTLVSGMAHQLNTPLGVIITANSVMRDQLLQIEQQLKDKKLNQQTLSKFIDDAKKTQALSSESGQKTADLIQQFKLISTEIEGVNISELSIKAFVEKKLALLSGAFKEPFNFQVEGDEHQIETYGDVVFKVLEQLVENSVEHNLAVAEGLEIQIVIKKKAGQIEIAYVDNGGGINDDIRKKIFDPFFTTKGMQKNLGLGLNVAYNAVQHILNGKLSCKPFESGAKFVIQLPVQVEPHQNMF